MSITHWLTRCVIFNWLWPFLNRSTRTLDASINVPRNCSKVFTWKVGWINLRCKFHWSAVRTKNTKREFKETTTEWLIKIKRKICIAFNIKIIPRASRSLFFCIREILFRSLILCIIENMFVIDVFNEIWSIFWCTQHNKIQNTTKTIKIKTFNFFVVLFFTWTGYQSVSKEIMQQFVEEYFFGVLFGR